MISSIKNRPIISQITDIHTLDIMKRMAPEKDNNGNGKKRPSTPVNPPKKQKNEDPPAKKKISLRSAKDDNRPTRRQSVGTVSSVQVNTFFSHKIHKLENF